MKDEEIENEREWLRLFSDQSFCLTRARNDIISKSTNYGVQLN